MSDLLNGKEGAAYPLSTEKDRQAFTRRETARIWGVSEGLVIKLDTSNRIKTIRISARKLVPREEIERVLREGVR